MQENICHFIPYHKDYHSIHTINFVLETKPQIYDSLKSQSVYKMYYVCNGTGFIHTPGRVQPLSEGDIFFTFPAAPFCIESGADFSYMYISFIGSRANMIMQKLKISKNNFLFSDCAKAYDFWKSGIGVNSELTDLISESILLYTFFFLGSKMLTFEPGSRQNSAAQVIKKYVDDNFSVAGLSLESISDELSYNKKYISSVFKKDYGVGLVEYLNTIRIQHSCTLIKQGFTSVCDIAAYCGYSDPQYFSKVFKQKMGLSPSEYIRIVMNDKRTK